MQTDQSQVPNALRNWFIVHFFMDILFAIPLFIFPSAFLQFFGWQVVDPYTARVAAAALFGIGIESWLGRNASIEAFREMLNLKVIWSSMAVLGIAWSLASGALGRPWGAWLTLGIFLVFNIAWIYWRRQVSK